MKNSRIPVQVTTSDALRRKLLDGIGGMVRVVAATYGPRGRTVMLDRAGGLLSTRDGVSVAWEIGPSDPVHRVGTRLVQKACAEVNDACGDGTTATAILVHAILAESFKMVAAGAHPAQVAQELREMGRHIVKCDLFDVACPEPVESDEQLREVALVACEGDSPLADAIVDAMGRVGSEGLVVVEEGKGRGVEVEHRRGTELEGGWESSDLAAPDGVPRHLDVPLVALVDGVLESLEDVRPVLEEASQFPHPLLILSRGCFGMALQTVVANDRKLERADGRVFEAVVARAPGHEREVRDRMDDVAALTGATVIDPKYRALSSFAPEDLGSVQTATIGKDSTTLVAFEDKFPLIEARVERLQRAEAEATHSHDAEEIRTRIAKITDGLCVMRIGGSTDAEIREKRSRAEDALNAVRVAIEDGVVPGAGIACLALSNFLNGASFWTTSSFGTKVLAEALRAPLRTLARNAGHEPSVVEQRVLEASREPGMGPAPSWETGWDATTNEIRDLRRSPAIRDPRRVIETAVLTAISTAATLLTAEVALTRVRDQ